MTRFRANWGTRWGATPTEPSKSGVNQPTIRCASGMNFIPQARPVGIWEHMHGRVYKVGRAWGRVWLVLDLIDWGQIGVRP